MILISYYLTSFKSNRPQYVYTARNTSNGYEETLISSCNAGQPLITWQFVLGAKGEIIEKVAYFLLLKNIIEDKLFVCCGDKEMLIVKLNITNHSVIGVNLVAANIGANHIHHSYLRLCCNYDVVLNEVHPHYFLTVDIEVEKLLLFLKTEAHNIAFNITKSNYILFTVYRQ